LGRKKGYTPPDEIDKAVDRTRIPVDKLADPDAFREWVRTEWGYEPTDLQVRAFVEASKWRHIILERHNIIVRSYRERQGWRTYYYDRVTRRRIRKIEAQERVAWVRYEPAIRRHRDLVTGRFITRGDYWERITRFWRY